MTFYDCARLYEPDIVEAIVRSPPLGKKHEGDPHTIIRIAEKSFQSDRRICALTMFRIRRVFDDIHPANSEAVKQVQDILREQFPLLNPGDIDKIPDMLRNPLKHRFKSFLYVAEDFKRVVKAFALVSHEPVLKFVYLDYIAAGKDTTGGGVGGALYERIREEALALNIEGVFMECLPDDPKLCSNGEILRQNRTRLKFYEKFGVRPIMNTAYETPLAPGDENPPYLIFDNLGQDRTLCLSKALPIVRAILERKYGHLCPPDYIEMVIRSFRDDPVRLRAPRYLKEDLPFSPAVSGRFRKIAIVVNDKHSIHHLSERGYVESPVRIAAILKELEPTGLFENIPPDNFSEKHIRTVHDSSYVDYFKRVCNSLEAGKSVYPYVFPIRNAARPPKELAVRAGYYCKDTFTPLNQNAFLAAKRGVQCALTAAEKILQGHRMAYALVKPPGHHAERRSFGGFCYFNNAAIAAHHLCRYARTTILDIDYHHGNGQQQIFYQREDVQTISIHGHPRFAYPHFSGFAEETGEGPGKGANVNYPLPEEVDGEQYVRVLEKALKRVATYDPGYLIVCLGLDTAKGDPTGTWSLLANDYAKVGKAIGRLKLPTLVIQEGGYKHKVIGANAKQFFLGLWSAMFSAR